MRKLTQLCLLALALAGFISRAQADVKMPAVFGSGMVLQREAPIPVWGWADPGEKIAVTFAGQTAETVANQGGEWKAELKAMPANAKGQTMKVQGKNALSFDDVLVGEVWVCSGQSNMEMGIGACNIPDEIAKANYPGIRLFLVTKDTSPTPLKDLAKPAAWAVCTPESIIQGGWNGFSAAAYFFGRDIHQKLGVPVGLIGTYWGGTPAQAWTSQPTLAHDDRLKVYLANWEKSSANYPAAQARYATQLAAWKKSGAKGRAPYAPQDPVKGQSRPANLFNAMINPLIPYAIRGAIWYQGEANASPYDSELYYHLFSTMIGDWRAKWSQGDFPFLFVQLANYMQRRDVPTDGGWPRLRESQLKTLGLKNTGMAVIIDIGEAKDIHPKDKLNVGKRLALAGLKVAYGQDLVYSGPIFDAMKVEGGKAVLTFKHVGGGLVSKPGKLKGFSIAGADKKFVWADAKIVGDAVEVSSPQVKEPAAVRYGWADNPEVSLYNKEGLPASPFRTDAWPLPLPKPAPKAKPTKVAARK